LRAGGSNGRRSTSTKNAHSMLATAGGA
jgi:hypothetical protein